MRSTFRILFYINKKRIKENGTTLVMCRISVDGNQKAISTGISCTPEDWNARKGNLRNDRLSIQIM